MMFLCVYIGKWTVVNRSRHDLYLQYDCDQSGPFWPLKISLILARHDLMSFMKAMLYICLTDYRPTSHLQLIYNFLGITSDFLTFP